MCLFLIFGFHGHAWRSKSWARSSTAFSRRMANCILFAENFREIMATTHVHRSFLIANETKKLEHLRIQNPFYPFSTDLLPRAVTNLQQKTKAMDDEYDKLIQLKTKADLQGYDKSLLFQCQEQKNCKPYCLFYMCTCDHPTWDTCLGWLFNL